MHGILTAKGVRNPNILLFKGQLYMGTLYTICSIFLENLKLL